MSDDAPAELIAAANRELDRALVASDPDRVAALFTVDAVLGESGMADIVGRSAIRDFLARANLVRTVTHHRLHQDELIILGDRAVERGRFDETKVKPGSAPIHERGRTVTFWRRQPDGRWLVERLVVSDLPSA